MTDTLQSRVVVLAPLGRDAELICSFLKRLGIASTHAKDRKRAIEAVEQGAAAAVLTEEALTAETIARWRSYLVRQPAWSDLPFIVLTPNGERSATDTRLQRIRDSLGNVTFLERPVRMESLSSAIRSCLRARERQYELRDFIEQQRAAEEALRKSEKLAVAGRLAATIAHEINNPLSAVMNLVYLVTQSKDLETCRLFAQQAQDELQRVSDIVNQTLRFHRVPTSPEETEIGGVLDSVLALFRSRFQSQNIGIVREFGHGEKVVCSPGEIRQVFINLIGNALDAMPHQGCLILRARSRHNPRDRRKGLLISVGDRGSGIPKHVRHRLMQPFFTTKGSTGTGLGLWITRDIIHRHRGSLRVRSRTIPPTGSVFSVWLPQEGIPAVA